MGPNIAVAYEGSVSKTQQKKLLDESDAWLEMINELASGAAVEDVTKRYRWHNPAGFDALIRIYDRNGKGDRALEVMRKGVLDMRKAFGEIKTEDPD